MDRRQQRNHTISKRHCFNCSANPPVKQIQISFALASLPPSEKLFPNLYLEYFFQANQGIFLQWELGADDHPFYRNLLCIRKCVACTQAYISKYNSSSFSSPASFAEPPTSVVHLQTCSRYHSPPALHCPAPLGAAGSDYQPSLTHRASVRMTQREIWVFSSNLRTLLICLGWPRTTALTIPLHSVIQLLLPSEPPAHPHLPYSSSCWCPVGFAVHQDDLNTAPKPQSHQQPSHTLKSYPITQGSWTDLPICF